MKRRDCLAWSNAQANLRMDNTGAIYFKPCQNYLHGQLVVTLIDFARAKQALQI